jgi:hypothetical protein
MPVEDSSDADVHSYFKDVAQFIGEKFESSLETIVL